MNCVIFLQTAVFSLPVTKIDFASNAAVAHKQYLNRNCSEPVLNSYASGDASHPESPDAT